MDAEELRRLLLMKLGLRIEPEMGRYLASRLQQSAAPVVVMGGDARTGAPRRQLVAPAELSSASLQQGSP